METKKWLIDANKVLEKADEVTFMGFYAEKRKQHFLDLVSVILEQSTVDAVEVVHGRWIKRTEVFGEIYCSECRTIEKTTDSNFKTPFCPWCGAEMDMEVDK